MTRIISIVGGLQPSTPTIGTATDGGTGTSANVAFTASSYIGKGTITYTATSSPGGFTGTGSSSPITVSGLTTGTAYTFTVVGTTNYGVTSLTSGSSNSVTPANPDSGSVFPIGSITVGSAGASSITFSSIPSTYTHLQIRAIARTDRASEGDALGMQFNGDTSNNYSRHQLNGDGSSASGDGAANTTFMQINRFTGASANTSVFGVMVADVFDYANTNKFKTVRTLGGYDNNTSGLITLNSGNWRNNAAVTSITLYSINSASLVQYSSFALYGIKGA